MLSDFHWRMILVLVAPRRKGMCGCVVCLPTCMVYVLCCYVFGVMGVCMLMYVCLCLHMRMWCMWNVCAYTCVYACELCIVEYT